MAKNANPEQHHHHPQPYERANRMEGWVDKATIGIILILGAAMAIGLLTASGNVTW